MDSECLRLQFGTVSNRIGTQWLGIKTNEDEAFMRQNGKYRIVAFDVKHRIPRPRTKDASDVEVSESWEGSVQVYDQSNNTSSQAWEGLWNWKFLDESNLFEVSSFTSFMSLHNFYGGLSESLGGNVYATDLHGAEDTVRKYMEECDFLRYIECLVDMDSLWAGFARHMMEYVTEECRTATIQTYANDYPYPLEESGIFQPQSADKTRSRRSLNVASSVVSLAECSDIIVPIAMSADTLPQNRFPEWEVDRHDGYRLSQLVAACLEAARSKDNTFRRHADVKILELAAHFPASSSSFIENLSNDIRKTSPASPYLPEIYSVFPASPNVSHKTFPVRTQQILLRGSLPTILLQEITECMRSRKIAFSHTNTPIDTSLLYRKRGDTIGLSIAERRATSAIPNYLTQLGDQVLQSDRRVLYEYTQSGMTYSLHELHNLLNTMCETFC